MTRYWFASLLLVVAASAQDVDRMREVAESYVTEKQFMGVVLAAHEDEVLLSEGYGFANLEWQIPNTPDTKFRLGSITKQFTAAAVLLLEEHGSLSINDPVNTLLPDAPEAWGEVTIYHLLTHTSGIPSFTGFPEYRTMKLSATTPEELLETFRDKPLEFEPGEKFRYSNSGYILLGYLVEKASGDSYADFLQEHIFDPLGMKDSGYDLNKKILPNRASGYTPSSEGPRNADFVDMTVPYAAGALYSTTADLLRWQRGLFSGKLLEEASLKKMTTPFKGNYALGVSVRRVKERKVVDHGGGIEGFNTHLSYWPEEEITAIALSNLNGRAPSAIVERLGALAHGDAVELPSERKTVVVKSDVLEQHVGVYEIQPGFDLTVTLKDGRLFSQATGQGQAELFAESETMFFLKVVDAKVEFLAGDDGAVDRLKLYQGGREVTAMRK